MRFSNLYSNKPSRKFWYSLKFENYCSTSPLSVLGGGQHTPQTRSLRGRRPERRDSTLSVLSVLCLLSAEPSQWVREVGVIIQLHSWQTEAQGDCTADPQPRWRLGVASGNITVTAFSVLAMQWDKLPNTFASYEQPLHDKNSTDITSKGTQLVREGAEIQRQCAQTSPLSFGPYLVAFSELIVHKVRDWAPWRIQSWITESPDR